RSLLFLAGVESAALGLLAGAIGTGASLLAVRAVGSSGAIDTTRVLVAFAVCVALGFAGAAAARLAASISVLRESVGAGRRGAQPRGRPLWQRLYLDLACLAGSGLIYWLTARTGFSAVVNPDSNPTLSISVYMFFAPALLWLGATLLLLRLRGRLFAWAARRAVPGGRASARLGFLLSSASRR